MNGIPIHWWQRAVIYQVYPRSFADTDGDGIGDLAGITARLDYLNDGTECSLGVEAIWLSPFYPSPMADFGYDIANYTDVDPIFGTLAEFDRLLEEAHRRGIKVIIDWVPNHTSDQHPWFRESRSGRDSAKREWYVWRDPASGGGPPNNWLSTFAKGSAWTFDQASGQYYLHSFLPQQPDLNWDNPEVESAMHEVVRFWLDRGVDGFRIDAVHKLGKDPDLRDNEPELRHDQDWPTVHERLRRIRALLDEYHERMLVGEVYIRDLERVVQYVNTGDELHLAHNFVFVHLPWNAAAFRSSVQDFDRLAEKTVWPAWFLENHDHPRVPSRYAAAPGSGERRARVALMLVCALRGTPFVYQGEELGMPDTEIPADRVVDVDGRDPERTPFPWRRPSRAGPGAGFTTGSPWLPIVDGTERLAAEAQDGDADSTLEFSRRLIRLRRRTPALHSGAQRSLETAPEVLCFVREYDERILVALNFSSRRIPLGLHEDVSATARLELSTHSARDRGESIDLRRLVLEPDEGVIVRLA
jgi:alpha-glucosidase